MNVELWPKVVTLAEHYKAIGTTDIWLHAHSHNAFPDAPWHIATDVEFSGIIRGGVEAGLTFIAEHPCGITFRWGLDLATWDNGGECGSRIYEPNVRHVLQAFSMLPTAVRDKTRALIVQTFKVRRKLAADLLDQSRREFRAIGALYEAICDEDISG
jgi:hypothetical protein